MSKVDLVAAQKAAIVAGQDAALQSGLETMYDGAYAEGLAQGVDAQEQEKIDAAVATGVGPLNAQIAQDATDLAAANADAATHLASLQAALDDMTAMDLKDKAVVKNFKASLAALQAALDALVAAQPVDEPTV